MEKADYPLWYERAKENTDVEQISKHFLQYHEAVKEYLSYIRKEEKALKNLVHTLEDAGFEYIDIEDTILLYGGVIQSVYLELGVKIGSRLGADILLRSM